MPDPKVSTEYSVSRLRKNAQHLVSKFEFLLASTQIQHRKSLRHCLIQINARRPRRRSGIAASWCHVEHFIFSYVQWASPRWLR